MSPYSSSGYGFEKKSRESLICALGAYQIVRTRSDEEPVRHVHPFWVISCRFGENEQYSLVGNKGPWSILPKNIITVTPPNTPYWQNYSKLGSSMKAAFITFTGGAGGCLQKQTNSGRSVARFLDADGSFTNLLKEASEEASVSKEQSFVFVQAVLYNLLSKLFAFSEYDSKAEMWKKGELIQESKSFSKELEDFFVLRLAEKISVKRVAYEFGLSIPGLFKRCRTEGLTSPMRFQAKLRIERARILLMQGESLKSISYQTGFYDTYHLSRVFKQLTGCSPRSYLNTKVKVTDFSSKQDNKETITA